MSDRDPLLAILRGLHDAVASLANTTHWAGEGMSLRDYFAAKAMAALIAEPVIDKAMRGEW